jgi:membrane-bound ClpP family serine protease
MPARLTVLVDEEDPMKLSSVFGGALLALATAVPGGAPAETAKTYQVTGPVLEVTDSTITAQKGKEKWQLARDKETKGAEHRIHDVGQEHRVERERPEGEIAVRACAWPALALNARTSDRHTRRRSEVG